MNETAPSADQTLSEHGDVELPNIDQLSYPEHDLATASRVLLILSDPNVSSVYDVCVKYVDDESGFRQSFAELQQACMKARDAIVDTHLHALSPIGMAYCYASAYQEVGGHEYEFERELKLLLPTFSPVDPAEQHLQRYTEQVLESLK